MGPLLLERLPDREVGDPFKVRIVRGDACQMVSPHDGKIESIIGEQAVIPLDVMAAANVGSFEGKDLDTEGLDGLGHCEMPDKFLDVGRVILEVTDRHLGLEMEGADGLDDHQAMKGFGQNQAGCEAGEPSVLDPLEELGAVIGELSRAGEVVDENIGVDEDRRAVRNGCGHQRA